MSAPSGLIRWERLKPAGIALVVLALLIYFFLDPVIRWTLIKAGQAAFGARVNIEAVKTQLRKGRLSIRGLQVADKSEPMKNLFQWSEAVFDFRSLPLLEKKVVIDEASLSGLRFGSARKTSGELRFEEKQPGFVGKAMDKLQGQVEKVALDKFDQAKTQYDPKTLLDPKQLKTLQAAEQAKAQLQKAPEEVQNQINKLNAQQRAADLQKRVQALKQSDNSAAGIAQKLQDVKTLQSELQALRTEVAATQRTVTDQIQSAQNHVEDVKRAREEDWKALRARLALPTLDKTSLARSLFGSTVTTWTERLLNGVHMARSRMPAKPKSPPPPPRGRARTIEFPRLHDVPRFLLVKAQLSGEVGQERPFGFTGTLTGITSNPPLYGKPATLQLDGAQGARSFRVQGMLDHTQEIPAESLDATYNGFSLSNTSFGQADSMAFALKQGEGRAHLRLGIKGNQLDGRAEIQGSNLGVEPHVALNTGSPIAQRAAQNITRSLSNVKAMNVGIGIEGTLESPQLDIDSNIGAIVADALKTAFGAEVAEQEKALRAQFDQQTAGKIQELQGSVDGLKQKALPQLAGSNKVIDDLLNQVKQQAVGGAAGKPLESLKGLFGR